MTLNEGQRVLVKKSLLYDWPLGRVGVVEGLEEVAYGYVSEYWIVRIDGNYLAVVRPEWCEEVR